MTFELVPVTDSDGAPILRGLTRPLCILDSEWTSGAPDTARLVQLCIRRMEVDGTHQERSWLVNPSCPIEAGAQEVHGISAEDVADAPPFRHVAGEVADLLAGADIGGYGVDGDVQILERELTQAGKVWYPERVSIVDGLRLWQHLEPRSLADAYRRYVLRADVELLGQAHDATADVEMAGAVLAALAAVFASRQPGGVEAGATADELHEAVRGGRMDPAGRFQRRADGVPVFTFGKHRLLPVREHPEYLAWMLRQDFPASTLRVAAQLKQTEVDE